MAKKEIKEKLLRSGMMVALGVTALTGYRILRPMKLHPIAGSIFLGLSLIHMYINREKSENQKGHHHRQVQ